MRQHKPIRHLARLLGGLTLLAGLPAVAQDAQSDFLSPAPVCRARPAEFQPRVELLAPQLSAERRERGRNIVVLNGRGFNYTSRIPGARPPRPLTSPAPAAPQLP